jgi:hypothetical protein
LASEEKAWHETRGLPGCRKERNLNDDTKWGITGTKGCTSMTHLDDDGLATAVRVMAGSKYWVVMKPRNRTSNNEFTGDLSSIEAFPLDFDMCHSGHGHFEGEGVHLIQGDVL